MDNQNRLNKFFSYFNFKINSKNSQSKVIPTKPNTSEIQQFPSYVNELFNAWKQSITQTYNFEDRKKMYQEMDNMFEMNSIMNSAKEIRVHECIQGDVNNQIIQVEAADKKLQKRLESTLERLGVDSYLYATETNITKYGDAGWILTFNDRGVAEILNVDPFDIDDRLEFTPHDVEKMMRSTGYNQIFRNLTNDSKMGMLAQSIMEEDEYASFFRSYLFGFQVGSFVLPPWRFLHFRNFETNSFFAPFGVPAYIYALAPVKMYDMALGLQILARQARMPTDVYKLNLPPGGMPTDKLELATQFIRAWQASGLKQTRKENNGLGEAQVTIRDLFDWEQQTPNIDLGRIDDLELLRDDIILATGLPRNFLDPNNGSFGNSGISLIQQFKPFARKVYKDQTILLEQITQLLKIDLIQSGDYEVKDIEFKLSMPYPESQTNPELISSQQSLFDLSNAILDGIKERLSGGQDMSLPTDLIRSVYKKVTSFDPVTMDQWIDMFVAEREKQEKQSTEGESEGEEKQNTEFTFESVRKGTGKKFIEKIINEETSRGKIRYATEHASGGRHYMSSRKVNLDFNIERFEKINTASKVKLMNEELGISNGYNEFISSNRKKSIRKKLREEKIKEFNEEQEFEETEVDEEIDLNALNEGE